MNKNIQNPEDLLNDPIEVREEYFMNRNINHPHLRTAFKDVMEKIMDSKKGKVYLVFGPTGVGKSTLFLRVKNEILSLNEAEMQRNRGIIPVVSLELPSPDNGKFNWKDFYQRILIEFNEPLIGKKTDYENPGRKSRIRNYLPNTAPELRKSLENAICYRETKVVLLDEAQHLLKTSSGKRLNDQMDSIKSIANLTGAIFVLFGTYELMNFFDLNGQLSRRTNEIHFPRYDFKNKQDVQIFRSVINTFQTQLPLKVEPDLLSNWRFLYERSVGCIGILKEWLDSCFKDALRTQAPTITVEMLKKHAPAPRKAHKIANEAIDGERNFEHQEDKLNELQVLLGLSEDNDRIKTNTSVSKQSKNKRVGIRKPIRDKTGIVEENE
ncbi:AAA family ATPase [Bacillus sp. JJ1127]|uniref:AAA family ATPase n=1 Tax=Bacillus sp. JJ1127 TaxID=3122952 RepID=UPI0030006DEA